MKLKFWKKEDEKKDETTIKVTRSTALNPQTIHTEIYVNAQTSEKAMKLYRKLKKEEEA